MQHLSSKVRSGKSLVAGNGLFADEPIAKGEIILDLSVDWHHFITEKEAAQRYKTGFDYMIQVDDDLFVITVPSAGYIEQGYLNHSCDPNCGIKDILQVTAIRDIEPGEELSFDYAMSESSEYEMSCACRSPQCRKIITGNDWRIPLLQQKYAGYFSRYLEQKKDIS